LGARRVSPQVGIIDVQADLTGATEPALMRAYAAVGDARAIVLNFSGLGYMNSTGIGLLVTLLVRAKRQGQTLLACCLSEHYQHIFELTRLDDVLRVYATEAEAIQAAGAR
jgi:anti-anti-sigma factor